MKLQLSTLYWDNFSPEMIEAHKKVMDHYGLKVNYTKETIDHGIWLNRTIGGSKADVIGIIESDCVPIHQTIINDCIDYVVKNDSFIGIAQVANHIGTKSHIYAAPAFFFITKSCYERLGRPSFTATPRGDVAEELSYRAEQLGIRYRTIYPTCFEREPQEGIWPLGSYGYYGVGTVFGDSIYHLYQGRIGSNADLFVQRCNEIIDGTFSTADFTSSTTQDYEGRIVP